MRFKSLATGALIVGLCSIFFYGCSQGPWTEYKPDDGNFTVMFPGAPSVSSEFEKVNEVVSYKTTNYELDPKYGIIGGRYHVAVNDFTIVGEANLNWGEFDEAFFKGAKQGITKEGFEVLSENKVTMVGHEVWEYESTSDQADSTIRMFRVDHTIYALEVVRRKGKDFSEEREKFFNSFSLGSP